MTPAIERLLQLAEVARTRIQSLSPVADALVYELGEAIREVEETTPDIGALQAALKPFAFVARVFDADIVSGTQPRSGIWQSWPRTINGEQVDFDLTVEDLRGARQALTPRRRENGE